MSRKTIARGRRHAPTVPVCSCALAIVFLHARPRVQQAPGVPCALFRTEDFSTARAYHAARTRTHESTVIASAGKQSIWPRKKKNGLLRFARNDGRRRQ